MINILCYYNIVRVGPRSDNTIFFPMTLDIRRCSINPAGTISDTELLPSARSVHYQSGRSEFKTETLPR